MGENRRLGMEAEAAERTAALRHRYDVGEGRRGARADLRGRRGVVF